jgi:hypothetical protein
MEDIEFLFTDPCFLADIAQMLEDYDIEEVFQHPNFPKAMAAAMQRFQDQMDEWDGQAEGEAEGEESESEGEEDDMCPIDCLHDPNVCDFDHTEEQVRAWKENNPTPTQTSSQVASSKVAISAKKCQNGDDCRFNKQGRCKFTH